MTPIVRITAPPLVVRNTMTKSGVSAERAAPADETTHHYAGLLRTHSITLKQIRYFTAVAHDGKITAAARDINISPSSITEAVRHLEEILGVALFDRASSGMHLTREGHRFYGYCEKILALLNDASRAVKRPDIAKGALCVAASPAVQGYFLSPWLSRFHRLFPGVHLQLLEMERAEIEERVLAGEVDLGIVLVSNVRGDSRLHKRKLFSSPRTLWCAATHRLAAKKSVSLAEIAHEPYIQLTIDEAEKNTAGFWAGSGSSPKVFLRTGTIEALRGYVGQGECVTILSEMLFRPWSLEGDRIVSKPICGTDIPEMDVGIIWEKDNFSPQASLLMDFLYSRD